MMFKKFLLKQLEKEYKAKQVEARLSGNDPWRRSGRTTRLVNEAVEKFFTIMYHSDSRTRPEETVIFLQDHHGTKRATAHALEIFIDRMKREHNLIPYQDKDYKVKWRDDTTVMIIPNVH